MASVQPCNSDSLSCNGGNELHVQLWLTTKKLCEAEIAHNATKEAVAAGEEGVVERLEAAKADYELAYTLYHSACVSTSST